MILEGESKQRIRTLADLADHCRRLSDVELAKGVASGFLVCKPTSALHAPDGPQATLRVDLRLMAAVRDGRFADTCPVWPLRRQEGSVYSFLSVGRTQNCDVWIPDESISKLHALVRENEGGFQIVDAGSRNQTFVDARAVPKRGEGEPVPLNDHAAVRFGSIDTVFFAAASFRALVLDVVGPDLS